MASGLHLARLRCTGCGECCRNLRVPLTFSDVARLSAATGQPPTRLVSWASAHEVDIAGEPSSLIWLPEGPRVMLLAQRAGVCQFLEPDDRCGVHTSRPTACRAYPLSATLGPRNGIRRLRVLTAVECPYELAEPSLLRSVRRDQALLRDELSQHHQLVARFNRAQARRRRFKHRLAGPEELFAQIFVAPARSDHVGAT